MRNLVVLLVLGLCLAAPPISAQTVPPPGKDGLSPEQLAVVARMETFRDDHRRGLFALAGRLNGTQPIERQTWSRDTADYEVEVSRGKLLEKVGWMTTVSKRGTPPYVPDPAWNQYIEIDIHPKSPLIGFFHATVYLSFFKNGGSALAGYMDIVPATANPADLAAVKAAVERVFTAHGRDIAPFRHELCDSEFGAKHHRDRLKAACVGVSFYAQPMMGVTMENFVLVSDVYDAFLNAYVRLIDARAKQPFGPADLQAQRDMRKRWLEDQMFADTFSTKVVPYEVWSLANLPPAVNF